MPSNDLEYAVELGARLTRAAVGLGLHLALAPVRLALRAVVPSPSEPRWEPIDVPGPQPATPIVEPVAPPPVRTRPSTPNGASAAAPSASGPGPEIRVAEPWVGYDAMNVAAVLVRLRTADPALVAMVRLYEEMNKNRRGVLHATGGD